MKKIMILLAGYPATGKSYLANQIIEACGDFTIISQDDLKEKLFDQYGFDDLKEKKILEGESWVSYYSMMRIQMYRGKQIISDYPFCDKHYGALNEISITYGYEVVTIRLIGDLDVLYERSWQRDLDSERHLSHLVNKYHRGDTLENRENANGFLTYDVFMDRCKNNGYEKFQLGHLIEIDVTDFSKVDYPGIIKELKEIIK
ncbi:MAG TPA: AAA family ATPase [Candidatus Paceibacterota bacterium]